jgi:hypothetical protein
MKNTVVVSSKVLNKITKEVMLVADVSDKDEVTLQKIDVIDGKEVIDLESEVVLPLKSVESCFDVIEYGKQDKPIGYSIYNGELLCGGEPATEQGQLSFIDILATLPGEIILSAKTRDAKDDRIEVFAYKPLTDKFTKLVREVGRVSVTSLSDDRLAMVLRTIDPEVVVDEDGEDVVDGDGNKVTANVVKDITLALYENGDIQFRSMNFDPESLKEVKNGTRSFLVATATNYIGYDDYDNRILVSKDDVTTAILDADGYEVYSFVTKAPADSITFDKDGSVVALAGDTLYFQNRGHNYRMVKAPAVTELAGYPYLVDCDIRNSQETYVMANESYETKTLLRKKTYDRGDIVTIL